jgi:glycosyltransferase involved in cell wall biosynthesis
MSAGMRVLHVIPTIALEHGGPSHAVRLMAEAVCSLGAEVHVAATSYGTPEGNEDPARVWDYEENGVAFHLFPQVAGSRWNLSWGLTRWLFTNATRFDILHVHAPFAYPTWPACVAARHAGVPYVYRPLGTLDPWSLRQKAWKKWPYYWLIERRNLFRAHRVHVTSAAEREAVETLGAEHERVTLIPIGIPAAPPRIDPPRDGVLRLLFIGRLHPKKGIPLVLQAMATLRANGEDVVLEVAGSGDPAYAASLRAEIEKLALGEAVRFVGFATGAQKERLFAESDVFVLPAYDENFGISVAEAMARGVPVVISEAVGLADHVRTAGAGRICRTGDPANLADAIRSLASPEARRIAGARGVSLVAAEFSTHVMGQRLMTEYRSAEGVRPFPAPHRAR